MLIVDKLTDNKLWDRVLPATSLEQLTAAIATDPFKLNESTSELILTLSHEGLRREASLHELDIQIEYFGAKGKKPHHTLELAFAETGQGNTAHFMRCYNFTNKKHTGFGRTALGWSADLVLANAYDAMQGRAAEDGIFAWPKLGASLDMETVCYAMSHLMDRNKNHPLLDDPEFQSGHWQRPLHDDQYAFELSSILSRRERILATHERMGISWDRQALQAVREAAYPHDKPFSSLPSTRPGNHAAPPLVSKFG